MLFNNPGMHDDVPIAKGQGGGSLSLRPHVKPVVIYVIFILLLANLF